ncbi:nitroreductase family protein [bacterium]|nr:nitroreductase family protein [bacterium]
MDILKAIKKRRSVRGYLNKGIPEQVLNRVLEAARLAPTAANKQPFKLILVTDKSTKAKLVEASKRQTFIAEAPIIIVGCAFPEESYQNIGGTHTSEEIDVSIVFDHLMLQAAEEGLGTCWIGAFDEDQVKAILNIPSNVKVIGLTPLGYPSKTEFKSGKHLERKSLSEIILCEKYWESICQK